MRVSPVRVVSLLTVLGLVLSGCSILGRQSDDPEPSASSSASEGAEAGLVDASGGGLGQEWTASPGDTSPWVQLTWGAEQSISSVQVWGPTQDAFDAQQSTAAALFGRLEFSNGTSVPVSGIAAGAGLPTVVAFPARSVSWVRLDLHRQIADATVGLREFTAYGAGVTPPQAPASTGSPTFSVTPPVADCALSGTAVSPPLSGRLSLACPTPGASVDGTAVIQLAAPAGAALRATVVEADAQGGDGGGGQSNDTTVRGDGLAQFTLDVSALPQGPFSVKVTGTVQGAALDPLYVQLFHVAGTPVAADTGSFAPKDLTLQYRDDFDEPLSVSQSGDGTRYAALKPEPWGGSQFGDAVFADPAWGANTLATLPGGWLRIRAQPIAGYEDHQTWGQEHIGGLLSSQRFGGSGFSAQYGYFEARMLGAPGPGAWSAFWMLNSESGTGRAGELHGEVDPVELYGHDTAKACHATHAWGGPAGKQGQTSCDDLPDGGDWASEWHTYGVQVQPEGAEFFVDGVSVARLSELSNTDEPFFFMLDLATNGGWPVDLAATGQTTDLYVDWVRVYT